MAVVRVQGTTATNSGTTNVVSATLTGVASGNLLIVGAFLFGSTTATATCSDGTSYTATPNSPATNTAGGSRLYLFYLPNAGAGSHTVTVTWSTTATAGNLGLWFTEFSGILTASPLDVDSVFTTPSAGTNINTPSITPTASGELLYFMAAPNATMTSVNSPWTVGTITSGDGDGYILSGTTSATAVNATQNSSATWVAMSAAFKIIVAAFHPDEDTPPRTTGFTPFDNNVTVWQ